MRVSLSIVLCFTLLSAAASAQTILYQEQFSGGTPENAWYPGFNGNTIEAASFPDNPSGDGWVGELGNHFSGGNVGESWSGSADLGNFYLEAQVYVPVDEAVYYGIEFRVDTTDLTSGYQFVARFRPGGMVTPRLRFRLRPDDNPAIPTMIRDWDASEVPGGIPEESGWHKMAVLAKGHSFWFWFDDQQLPGCPVLDYTRLTGAIGAYLWDDASPMMKLYIDDINVSTDVMTHVEETAALPQDAVLHQNHPNPVVNGTTIEFELPAPAWTRLEVYSQEGRRVAVLHEDMTSAGTHAFAWNVVGMPAGMYVARLLLPGRVLERRMVVIR